MWRWLRARLHTLALRGPLGQVFEFISSQNPFIGLSVFGSRIQAKDHGLGMVQRTVYPT